MLGRKIQTLLEVSREAKHPLLVGTFILVFLSIFTKSQASLPFEALNSAHLSNSQMDVRALSRRGWEIWLSLGSPQGIQTSLHLVRWKMSLHLRHCRESRPSFESGHLRVHYTWGRKHRVALTYLILRERSSWGACGNWLTFSVKDRESFWSPDDMGCTEVSSSCSNEIDDPLYLRRFSQGISQVS